MKQSDTPESSTTAPTDSVHPVVVFIYDSGGTAPCHAVRKNADGRWSKEHVAFCGWQAPVGPTSFLSVPQGGLCRWCAEHCSPHGEGDAVVWRSKTRHADPLAYALAEKLFYAVPAIRRIHAKRWDELSEERQLEWTQLARVAIDNYPVAAPYERDRYTED